MFTLLVVDGRVIAFVEAYVLKVGVGLVVGIFFDFDVVAVPGAI
jgi:hypothetical protein